MKHYYIFIALVGLLGFWACSDDDNETLPLNSEKTKELIQQVRVFGDAADIGTGIGQYLQMDKDVLLTRISDAETAVSNAKTIAELDEISRTIMKYKDEFLLTVAVSSQPLESLINSAKIINDEIPVGTETGSTTQENKDEFVSAISAAEKLIGQQRLSKKDADSTLSGLNAAMNKFESSVIAFIDEENMILYLKMDGNANDETGLNQCLLGQSSGEGRWATNPTYPTPTIDHKGNPGMALHFERGAHITIPSKDHFFADEFSLTVWFSVDDYRMYNEVAQAGDAFQYLLAQDTWNGMRISPCVYGEYTRHDEGCFFLGRAGNGEMNLWQNALDIPFEERIWKVKSNEWHFMAIVFNPTKCSIYLDGELVKEREVTNFVPYVNATSATTRESPIYVGIPGPNAEFQPTGDGWETCLWGSVNDMRIFKKSLSKAEVKYIYNVEK